MTPASQATVTVCLRRISALALPPAASVPPWLSDAESHRLASLRTASRRAQFIAGHGLARQCLAARTGGRWQDYVLSAPDDAPPAVLQAPTGVASDNWHFSLSHSGDWLACAVAPHPIGVDVERSDRTRDFAALNAWVHDAEALHAWQAMPAAARQRWFYAQWTLKEAWLKQRMAAARDAHGPAGMHAMSAVRFCEARSHNTNADRSNAMVGIGSGVTLAVYPVATSQLQADTGATPALTWTAWADNGRGTAADGAATPQGRADA